MAGQSARGSPPATSIEEAFNRRCTPPPPCAPCHADLTGSPGGTQTLEFGQQPVSISCSNEIAAKRSSSSRLIATGSRAAAAATKSTGVWPGGGGLLRGSSCRMSPGCAAACLASNAA